MGGLVEKKCDNRMKVLFWTLLVALFIQAQANSKTDCQNEVKETVGKFIEKCQKEYSDKCARYDHNGDQEISKIEADKSLIRLLEKCQDKTDQKSLGNKTNRERRPGYQQRSKAKDECKKQVIDHIESLKGELSAKEAKDKYYQLIKRCEPKTRSRQPSWRTNGRNNERRQAIGERKRTSMNIQRLKNDLKILLECQALNKVDRSLTDGPCAEAKKRKILSVKNVDELTDEKIELYTNRMKETILKERTKATRQAAANKRTETRREMERRQTQGLKLSLTLERKLTECQEKSLDPCEIDGKKYSLDQVKAALPQIKTENQRRQVIIRRNRQRQRAAAQAESGNRRKPKSRGE